jgi:hypothetical protein
LLATSVGNIAIRHLNSGALTSQRAGGAARLSTENLGDLAQLAARSQQGLITLGQRHRDNVTFNWIPSFCCKSSERLMLGRFLNFLSYNLLKLAAA